MAFTDKAKKWLQENAPNLLDNKYLGMVYDRFASLPPKQQRLYTTGAFTAVALIVGIWILSGYLTLFGYTNRSNEAQEMLSLIARYEKAKATGGSDFAQIEKNRELIRNGALRNFVMTQARVSKISPRSIKVEETMRGAPTSEDEESGPRMKVATVELERVNLNQMLDFMQSVEFGIYTLGVSSLKIENDPKYRGYMNAQVEVIAHLVDSGVEE